ncbi:STAS/SEC14 domain-containing protein [Polyangium mundeleinium]|uniref:STAS/SEC14 domain-containing protein n=1 Tax=Polyangium mundeleinium TaxID=2995306 RepID=A0ABT5EI84_9BACT|nr:STAS/SEC14 domain-containing protein [Polyangium mundeleinium]MDC0741527.1 STAS/SEC14 domain-containing protein [Polyangium mundeleinium]
MDTPSDDWSYIGAHPIRFEPPDIVLCRPNGYLSGADVRGVLDFSEKRAAQLGRSIFYLGDSSRITGYAISTSLQIFNSRPTQYMRGTAIFGANFQQRMQNSAVLRAARRLGLPMMRLPIETFPDEASARAWIDELRRQS